LEREGAAKLLEVQRRDDHKEDFCSVLCGNPIRMGLCVARDSRQIRSITLIDPRTHSRGGPVRKGKIDADGGDLRLISPLLDRPQEITNCSTREEGETKLDICMMSEELHPKREKGGAISGRDGLSTE
jgi:hypothetical protein